MRKIYYKDCSMPNSLLGNENGVVLSVDKTQNEINKAPAIIDASKHVLLCTEMTYNGIGKVNYIRCPISTQRSYDYIWLCKVKADKKIDVPQRLIFTELDLKNMVCEREITEINVQQGEYFCIGFSDNALFANQLANARYDIGAYPQQMILFSGNTITDTLTMNNYPFGCLFSVGYKK